MTQRTAPVTTLHRRDFLKLTATGTALLSAGALTATLAGCSSGHTPAKGYAFLRDADLVLFTALTPAVLGSTLPEQDRAAHIEQVLKGIDGTAARVLLPTQKALYQLFDLLNTGLTRRLAARVKQPWNETSPVQAKAFLDYWENSSISLFNAGYRGLTKFVIGAWVSTDAGLAAAGYPGPWQPMFDAVNST